jgi:F0F1-type ATP synthase epsilon subunit
MDTFKLTIVEECKIPFISQARYCRVTTPSGMIGFEPRHEGFVGTLLPGSEVEFTDGSGQDHTMTAAWGVLLFEDNACVITMAEAREG